MFSWDNIDGLHRLLSVVVIAWAVISALLGVLSWKVQSRISELNQLRHISMERELSDTERKLQVYKDKPQFVEGELNKTTVAPVETVIIPKTIIEKKEPELTDIKPKEVETPTVVSVIEDSKEQQFIGFLQNKPKGDFTIKSISGDESSFKYAKEIEKLLIAAGYKSNGIAQTVFRTPPRGVSIIVKGINSAPPYAGAIQKAFEMISIDAPAEVNSYYPENTLTIVVGQKSD